MREGCEETVRRVREGAKDERACEGCEGAV